MNTPELVESVFQFMFAFRSRLNAELELAGLSAAPMHMKLLKMVGGIPDCTAQKIAHKLNRDKAQINRAVQDMISKGYVIKEPNPMDKRSQLLVITEQGKSTLQLMNDIEKNLAKRMSKGIPDGELKNFISMTDKFRSNL